MKKWRVLRKGSYREGVEEVPPRRAVVMVTTATAAAAALGMSPSRFSFGPLDKSFGGASAIAPRFSFLEERCWSADWLLSRTTYS